MLHNKAKKVFVLLALVGGLAGAGFTGVSPAVLVGSTATAGAPDIMREPVEDLPPAEFKAAGPDLRSVSN